MRLIDRLMMVDFGWASARAAPRCCRPPGRRSEPPRVTPLTDGLDGDHFWIVTEHGRRSNYVRNLLTDPHLRVKAGGR